MAKSYRAYGNPRGKSSYKYTARRRAALRRAQLESARKRKRNKRVAVTALAAGGLTAGVLLGTPHGQRASKNIGESLKNTGKFGKDLLSAFKAVDPYVKEESRKERALTRKANARKRKREAVRKANDVTVLKPVGRAEQRRLQNEAEKRLGPTWLDSNTFNKDGTVAASVIIGTHLTDAELRQGIARNFRRRAANGGQGATRAEKNKIFKILKANQEAQRKTGEKVAPLTGVLANALISQTGKPQRKPPSAVVSGYMEYLTKQRAADERLLRGQ